MADGDVVVVLERWLQAHPPTTLLALADRLLIASVDRTRAEGPVLAQRFLPDVVAAAGSDDAVAAFTNLCVCTATLAQLGVDVGDLRFATALVARVVVVDGWSEPFRSTARYWRWRAGLARAFVDDGTAPADPRLAFAFHSHRVLFAAGYGAAVVVDAPGFSETSAGVDVDCGDSVGLALLCAGCVGRAAEVSGWWRRLAELCRADGTLQTHVDSDVARHHAACVAVLAASLAR